MKIEKISDNQIRFMLDQTDLLDRDIKFSELEYGSEKTHDLFQEMLEQASNRYGFVSESIPLVIEAIPMAHNNLMVLVTKVITASSGDSSVNIFESFREMKQKWASSNPTHHIHKPRSNSSARSSIMVFAFDSLGDIISISKRIVASSFAGDSSVYKHNGMYYLILENSQNTYLGSILSEFAYRYASTIKSKYHLMEHGELITASGAIEKYAGI